MYGIYVYMLFTCAYLFIHAFIYVNIWELSGARVGNPKVGNPKNMVGISWEREDLCRYIPMITMVPNPELKPISKYIPNSR